MSQYSFKCGMCMDYETETNAEMLTHFAACRFRSSESEQRGLWFDEVDEPTVPACPGCKRELCNALDAYYGQNFTASKYCSMCRRERGW